MSDFTLGDTLYFKFTTRAFATGVPTVLAGTPVLSAYEDDSITQITAGITLTVSLDSVVGLNLITIVATGGNGYEAGKQYGIIITTGTVGGVSVVGETIWNFTLENSASFTRLGAPAGASVSADIAVIEGQTDDIGVAGAGLTAINLPNQTMDIVGNITGNLSGSVGSVTAQVTADVTAISGDATAADNLELDYDGTGLTRANSTIGTVTTNTDMRGTDSALLAANINLSSGVVESNLLQMGGVVQSGTDLKDFADAGYDPVTNKVQGVVLVDTTTAVTNQVTADMTAISGDTTAANNLELQYDTTGLAGDTFPATQLQVSDMQGATFATGTDSLEAIRNRGDAAWTTGAGGSDRLLMVDTTIATLATQTSFTLTAGSADNDAYNNLSIVIEDVSTATQKAVGMVLAYVGSTKTVTLKEALAFTIATTDKVYILAENSLKTTVANRQLDVTSTGAAGIDWANVENPTTALDLSGTDIQLADTVTLATTTTTVTNQVTADMTAISGDATAADNAESFFDGTGYAGTNNVMPTTTAVTNQVTADMTAISGDATAANNLELQYDTTGLTGDTFPATQLQSSDIQGATFATGTDSLEAIRDRGDAAWTTGAGGSDRLLMVDTTIATLATQTSFTLTAGSADNDAYNNLSIVIEDVSTATQKAVGMVLAYVGGTKTVTLKEALAFTIATTDKVYILAENSLKTTVANRQLDVTSTGAAGIDWANVENPTTALDLSGTDIQLVDTATTVTNQVTSDVTAISGDSVAADNLELDYDGTGLTRANSTIGTVTTNTDMRGTDSALLAANINLSSGVVESNLLQMGGVVQSGTDLKDFADAGYDPATNKVQGVVLTDTTTAVTNQVTADMTAISGDAIAADNLELDYDGTGYAKANSTIGTTTTNTDMRGTNSAALAASLTTHDTDIKGLLPAALVGGRMDSNIQAIANNIITAASIATDAIGSDELAASASNEIADAILSRDIDNVEGTMALHSLGTAILKAVARIRDNAGTYEVYRTDGVTLHMSQAITVDAGLDPIDELGVGA